MALLVALGLLAAAPAGEAEHAYKMGRAYKTGDGVPLDTGRAEQWFEKAARGGLPKGEAEYGLVLYQNGKQRDAVPWLRKGAERGDRRAQYLLGTVLLNGVYAPKDEAEGRQWLQRAAKAGLPAAAEALAVIGAPLPQAPQAPVAAARGWRVQVGAFSSRANADRLWAQLKAAPPLAPQFRYDGRVTRLQIGPFDSPAQADAFCRKVRSVSRDCFRIASGQRQNAVSREESPSLPHGNGM
jgi:TPR repeat protein